jgi:HAD superfamily hydrolase (TIGR01509 family)
MSGPGYLATTSYHAHVFDFDGTIAETGDLNLEALCAALASAGAEVDVEWLRMEPLTSIEAVRERLHRERGVVLACSDGAIHRMGRAYWMAHAADLRPVGEVVAVIRSSTVPMAVASANDTQVVHAGLAALGLSQAFGAVVGRGDVLRHKPHPDAYLAAAAGLGVAAPRCLAFDNTDDGVASALAAGMDVIDVRTWTMLKPEPSGKHAGLLGQPSLGERATALVDSLTRQPWGQLSASVYETGRLVSLSPWLAGHEARISYLASSQRCDGSWGHADPNYALVPTLSATDALIGAGHAHRNAMRGFGWLAGTLAEDRLYLPDQPGIELIVPYLVAQINAKSGRPPLPLPRGADGSCQSRVADAIAQGRQIPKKLEYALEVAGRVAAGSASVAMEETGAIGASPAATAAWLGPAAPAPDHPARRYLEAAVAQYGGPVPVFLPFTVMERAWVLAWLLRSGLTPRIPAGLGLGLAAALGPGGAATAPGLPHDADTTAVTLYALALLGQPQPPTVLRAFELPTHFCSWPGESEDSVSTNAHVLEAFGSYVAAHPETEPAYRSTIAKISNWLCGQQRADGSWTDRWHISPYYATQCAVTALRRFGHASASTSLARARSWVISTQRERGRWGIWEGTREETAYAVQILASTGGATLPDQTTEFLCAPDDIAHPPLWIAKDPYCPTAIVEAAILAALRLGQSERHHDPRSTFPSGPRLFGRLAEMRLRRSSRTLA